MYKPSLQRLGQHPNLVTAVQAFIAVPLLLALLYWGDPQDLFFPMLAVYFLIGALEYLDGALARKYNTASRFGAFFERSVGFVLFLGISFYVREQINFGLWLAKLALDAALVLMCLSVGKVKIQSGLQYLTHLVLLLLAIGVPGKFVSPDLANSMLVVSIGLSLILMGVHLRLLGKHLIADALSACNLLCGLFAIYMATFARLDLSLLFILLGAGFDALDGAAARRFGSTRWGVYSDDIADGVSYGIAPGVIVAMHLSSTANGPLWEAVIVGASYSLFTLSRLIYFTFNKSNADPSYFLGAPSVLGGILVVSASYLFKDQPALLGTMVGVACILMVAFDTKYRHMGRLIASRRSIRNAGFVGVLALLVLGVMNLTFVAVTFVFFSCLLYGLLPMARNFVQVVFGK